MATRMCEYVAVACAVVLAAGMARGGDWAEWRGAHYDGISRETGWMTGQPHKLWTVDVGIGYSPATVVGDRLYTAGWVADEDVVWCLKATDGSVIWKKSYPADRFRRSHEGGPAGMVVVADGKAYLVDRVGTLRCYAAGNGDFLWEQDLASELSVKPPKWAFTTSPLVEGDTLYVDLGVIAALSTRDGSVKWKTRNYGEGYSSPVPYAHKGRAMIAAFPASGLVLLDKAKGSEVATFPWKTRHDVNAASPVILGDRFFISSGYNTGGALVQFDGKKLTELWNNKNMRNHMATCVVLGDYLYGLDDRQLACLSLADGSVQWTERSSGKGTVMAADGKLIVLSDKGELAIAEASPKAYTELARIDAVGGRNQWTVPVLAHGKIYCRSATGPLACIVFK